MAIAYDATSVGTQATTTAKSWSHTCTGTNRILFVSCMADTTDTVTSVTYNGVSMMQVGKQQMQASNNRWTYLYMLVNPASGTNTITINSSSSVSLQGTATSYTGANQTYNIDNYTSNSFSTSATSTALTLTTNQDNCWTFMAQCDSVGGETGGSGTTVRQTDAFGLSISDSNGVITPAGSNTLTVNHSSSSLRAAVMVSFAPASGSSIAFDNSAAPGNGVTSASFTTSGSNRFLLVSAYSLNDTVTGVTYGGVAMTLIGKTTYPGGGRQGTALYYLKNPASGSNTISVSGTAGGFLAASYNGVAINQPDSSNVGFANGTTDITVSTTVVASNCWLVMAGGDNQGGESGGSGTTLRNSTNGNSIADSNGTVSTGSQALHVTVPSANWAGIIASFAPAGVATSVKTVDGLAYASVKNKNGLAVASIKNFNGLA